MTTPTPSAVEQARDVIISQLEGSGARFGLEFTRAETADAIIAALADAGLVVVPRGPTVEMMTYYTCRTHGQ
jgi:hypothetical protein